jgi:hypothetical protein
MGVALFVISVFLKFSKMETLYISQINNFMSIKYYLPYFGKLFTKSNFIII